MPAPARVPRGPYTAGNRNRDLLRDALRQLPGCSIQEAASQTGLPWSVAAYHLRAMAARGECQEARVGRRVVYGPHGAPLHLLRLMRTEPAFPSVVRLLGRSPMTVAGLCQASGHGRKAVTRCVQALLDQGLVARHQEEPQRLELLQVPDPLGHLVVER